MATDIPLSLRTTYAELVERCAAADFEQAFAEAGTFTPKNVRDRRYWYFQITEDGKRKQRYVGPETDDLVERIARHKEARDDQRERHALVSTLVRSANLPRPEAAIGEVLAALSKAGVFRLRGVLVGTVAFQSYAAMLGARLPHSAVQTNDVDIAQFLEISKSVDDEIPRMLDVLRAADPSFRPVNYPHNPRRAASYATNEIRVDFLTPNRGPERDEPQTLRALGTDAQPLRFLGFLIREPEPAVVLHGSGVYVKVPAPQRYALHKLIVARRRTVAAAKSDKDLLQAQALLSVLVRRRPHDLRVAWDEAYGEGKKWRLSMLEGLGMIDAIVRDETLKVVGHPRSVIPGLTLRFDAPTARYDFDRDIVVFTGDAGGHPVRCAVSRETLEDHFGADGLDRNGRLERFRENREDIAEMAQMKYLEWPIEEPGSTLLKTNDVPALTKKMRTVRRRTKGIPT